MRKFVKFSGVIAMSLALTTGLTACGGMFTADKAPTEDDVLLSQDGRTLWESSLEYVKIVNRDVAGVANEHPAAISSDDLKTVLGAIYVSERIGLKRVENPLFSASELPILSTALSSGLSQADTSEDINFVSIGIHPAALAKERKTNTGRVFIRDGRLNIVFGMVHETFRDKDLATGQEIDRRLNPLKPGSRNVEATMGSARIVLDKGQSLYQDPESGEERADWIVIDIATVLATAKARQGEDQGDISPELLEDIVRTKQETGNLNEDVNSMKEVLFEMSGEIDRLKKEIEALKQQ